MKGCQGTAQISKTSDRCLGGTGERLGGCCKSHPYLLKSREEWDFIHMGKGTKTREIPPRIEAQGKEGKTLLSQYQCWQCGEVEHLRRESPSLKEKRLSPRGSVGAVHRD